MLTQQVRAVECATTYIARECVGAGALYGLQNLCSGVFTTRVAECFRAAITARKSGCEDATGAPKPDTRSGYATADVAAVVAKEAV